MDDKRIMDLLFSRSEEGLTQLRSKYGRLCAGVIRHILPDPRDVEECVSDALLRIWHTIPPERPRSLQAYLCRIARNLALDRYGHDHARMRSSDLTVSFEELAPCIPYVDDQEQALHLRQTLNAFLRSQPKQKRIMFVRRYFYGASNQEIAQQLSCSEEKVRVTLFRMRSQLRDALKKEGIYV